MNEPNRSSASVEMTQPRAAADSSATGAEGPPPETVPPAQCEVPLIARLPDRTHPSYVFLAVVSTLTFAADIASKGWAEQRLDGRPPIVVWKNHLFLIMAKNRNGAWGLLREASEGVRRPFLLFVSVAAILFIIMLYRRLRPGQRALKWGFPLVLGGALGNAWDRARYGQVIDFIDYRAAWVQQLNDALGATSTDHWPTYNVADIAICVGVSLMVIDMLISGRGKTHPVKLRIGERPLPPLPTSHPATSVPEHE